MPAQTRLFLEIGAKRVFASAADWPGWCRSGKTESEAIENLATYAPRYAKVAKLARIPLPVDATNFTVVERMPGNGTTEFGAPGVWAKSEKDHQMTQHQTDRMVGLAKVCWKYLDQVRAKAPEELRKGPRGGGRDREKMYEHVLGAEVEYAKAIGIRLKQPDPSDAAAVNAFRQAMVDGFNDPSPEGRWPVAFAIRRTSWHALDHAWEMEDRIP